MPGAADLDRHGFRNMASEGLMMVGRNGGVARSPRNEYRKAVQQAGLALRADRLPSPIDDGAGGSDERRALLAAA